MVSGASVDIIYSCGLDYLIVGDFTLGKNIDYDDIAEFDK